MEEINLENKAFEAQIENMSRYISEQDGLIVANTEKLEGIRYAFYLYVNQMLIEKSSYISESKYTFKTLPTSLNISVKFFYLDTLGNKHSVKEEKLFDSDLIIKSKEIFSEKSDQEFFEESLILLLRNDISSLIAFFEARYMGLGNKHKSRLYIQLINHAKSNGFKNSSLQVLSKIALSLYEDRYTLMAHAGVCINTGSIVEANQAILKLQNAYQVEEEKIAKLKTNLLSTLEQHIHKIDLNGSVINIVKNNNKKSTHSAAKYNKIHNDKYAEEYVFTILDKEGAESLIKLIDSETLSNKAKATLALKAAKVVRSYTNSRPIDFEKDTNLLASYAYSLDKSESTLRNVYFAYQRTLQQDKLKEVIKLLSVVVGSNPTQRQRKLLWSTPQHLMTLTTQVPDINVDGNYQPIAGRVCYVIHNSLPYSSGGYATRGHGLLTALKGQGLDIYAITRPGYPHDISQVQIEDITPADRIDDVVYKRLLSPSRRDYSNYEYILKSVESYKQAFEVDKPALIIAASNHLDGMPAMFAARALGIPFIYEIRGFWEITRLSKYPEFEQDPMFEVEKRLEAVVAENADHVFTLTQGMVDELESRGVPTKDRVTLLPNSCNIERFNLMSKDIELAAELNIPLDVPVIGYVGTLVSYEGLDDLAFACSKLKQLGYTFRLLIVGNEDATGQSKGSIVKQVEQIAHDAGFMDWLIMPGRIPFEQVERYYSLIDIAPFPRKAWPVCEIVPPMKTLEALSMKKAVLVSSNKALTEMITHDVNGRVFERGNTDDLVVQLKYLLDHPEKWLGYGEEGRIFVENERTWQRTAEKASLIIRGIL
ncbi:glycosyltransferase family 4 protein [Psychrobacter sp. SWN149]|uniref:glycosyltransferase family 4 protein n=1 Tax=Psychrobacter sp. SWN149 TaxID=2792057 RepID=UPI0018CE613F|nr:glycosyltransferase family 4 protein [Psychrobacter sp. SWN149]MBH0005395.1 glycosyltransferase [Psychrobacter sp. SWN149]